MVLKIKTILSLQIGDQVKSKYIIKNEFWPFQIIKKGAKLIIWPKFMAKL